MYLEKNQIRIAMVTMMIAVSMATKLFEITGKYFDIFA